ncbi:MAG: hypothetical protein KDK69_04040 [Chlamydiia bacterium]|nr:hypothetical protein [Chlamydiia bacterium]
MGKPIEGYAPLSPQPQHNALKRTDCCSLKMMLQFGTYILNQGLPFQNVKSTVCSSCRKWEIETYGHRRLNHLFTGEQP